MVKRRLLTPSTSPLLIPVGGGRVARMYKYAGAPVPLFTFNMADGTLESGQTFGRASTAYHQQPDGTWVAVASGEARFSGMRRVSEGVYSALDSGGAALSGPFGWLQEPVATNLILQSHCGAWFATSTFGSGTRVANLPGITGEANKAATFTDANGAGIAQWRINGDNFTAGSPVTAVLWIKKDADTSRYPAIGAGCLNGTSFFESKAQINTSTGATSVVLVVRCTSVVASVLETIGGVEYWKVALSLTPTAGLGNVTPFLDLIPAHNTAWGTGGAGVATTQGSVDAAFGMLFASTDNALALAQSPIVTAGSAVTRAVDTLSIAEVPADNETRITYTSGSPTDIDDWDGTVPTPTAPVVISKIEVYAPGGRPA